jgi:hydrogenase nickel incorporation protein HypA/HybF
MHELSIAHEIIRIITSEQVRRGFGSVSRIKLRAGALSGINPKSLQFAFEVIRKDTCAAHAEMEMDVEPMEIVCRRCGHRMNGEHGPRNCPECGSTDVMLNAGTHFEIVSLEVI